MKKITINTLQPDPDKIQMVRDVLKDGGVIVYPTDTLYGLGANIYDDEAVIKIYNIKRRSYNKPVSICLSSVPEIDEVAYMDEESRKFVYNILPGPFTLILRKKKSISTHVTSSENIGIRIPDLPLCREICTEFPITTTSANISGQPTPTSLEEITKQLGDEVDMVIDSGWPKKLPSTVVDLTTWPPKITREGAGIKKVSKYLEEII
jgi:L-threonylcarbamoyladenylate synthase